MSEADFLRSALPTLASLLDIFLEVQVIAWTRKQIKSWAPSSVAG